MIDAAVCLAGGADHRGVDDRQQLVEMPADETVESSLVAVLERRQERVALEIRALVLEIAIESLELGVERRDCRWQQAVEPERTALLLRKRRPLVQHRVREQRPSTQRGRQICLFGRGIATYGKRLDQ